MIVESGDGLAFLGPMGQESLFYATGYSGNGITYAVIAAHLFRDFVLNKDNPLQKIYGTDRPFDVSAHINRAEHYIGEFFGGAFKNWLP
jgi:glycine/D-amino acid oxidase-like deaminating enzyme